MATVDYLCEACGNRAIGAIATSAMIDAGDYVLVCRACAALLCKPGG